MATKLEGWEAPDGTRFKDEQTCVTYEKLLPLVHKVEANLSFDDSNYYFEEKDFDVFMSAVAKKIAEYLNTNQATL